MTSGVPWEVEGIPPQALETAQEAARRSGMSVGEWLDTVISDRARNEGAEPGAEPARHPHGDDENDAERHAYAEHDDHRRRAPAEDMAEVRGRLDEVGRQLDRLSRQNAAQILSAAQSARRRAPRELLDVIWRVDRRLDQLIASGRLANEAIDRRVGAVDRHGADPNRATAARCRSGYAPRAGPDGDRGAPARARRRRGTGREPVGAFRRAAARPDARIVQPRGAAAPGHDADRDPAALRGQCRGRDAA